VFGTVFAGVVPVAASCQSGGGAYSTSGSSGPSVACSFAQCGVAQPCFGDQCSPQPLPDVRDEGDGEGGEGEGDGDAADVKFG
jgi:hypothetical protein